jgi:Zn-dependent peptidase ImmA (M78 family)
MATVREAILEGVKKAQKFHDELDIRHTVESGGGRIDVFGALLQRNVLLIFRPLEGLLGAYLSQPARGVIISTQRPLSIQRFTGAHELGHVVLGHEASLDSDEILTRMDREPRTRSRRVLDEIMADAFAAEFLVPKWLLQEHARRQGWNRDSMQEPVVVYQMSLRIGASYEATCRALRKFNIVDEAVLIRRYFRNSQISLMI